jgi:CBS domain-containing protein
VSNEIPSNLASFSLYWQRIAATPAREPEPEGRELTSKRRYISLLLRKSWRLELLVCPLLYCARPLEIKAMSSQKLVKHVMRPLKRFRFVKEDETVREAMRLLDEAGREGKSPCLIVVGGEPSEKDVIKGFLTSREILFGLTTRFLSGAEKSGPIFWEGQFEAECFGAMNKQVGEVMAPIRAHVRETEMLMEAVFLLKKCQEDFLPAVGEGEVVGIIHIDDILTHITTLSVRNRDGLERQGGSV